MYRARSAADAGPRRVRAELAEGFRWLARQRLLRTMAVLIGLLNLTLTAATAVLVLLARERLHLGAVGYGALFTCEAAGALLGSVCGATGSSGGSPRPGPSGSACWSRPGCT